LSFLSSGSALYLSRRHSPPWIRAPVARKGNSPARSGRPARIARRKSSPSQTTSAFARFGRCTREQAEYYYRRWHYALRHDDPISFRRLADTSDYWREAILNFFDFRISNGFIESQNKRLQLLHDTMRGVTFPLLRAKMVYHFPLEKTSSSARKRAAAIEGRRFPNVLPRAKIVE